LIIIAAGGFFGYRILGGASDETVAAVEPATPAETTPSAAPESEASMPATETAAPGSNESAPSSAETTAPAVPAGIEAPPSGPSATVAGTTNAKPALPKTPRPRVAKATASGTEPASKTQPAQPPGAQAAARVAAVARAPPPDRWQLYSEAMAQCEHLDFFSRIGCEQRQRWHYCEGYWGQVPQCPGAPTKDHGS
jgi:hypothetical protein